MKPDLIPQSRLRLAGTGLTRTGEPMRHRVRPRADAASGRGLAMVRALTSLLWVSDGGEIRILLAIIPAQP
jgi:hypothetical protein